MHFVYSFVGMPVATKPRQIVCVFFDRVELLLCAVINRALVDSRQEHLNRLIFERACMGKNHVNLVRGKPIFNYCLHLRIRLFIVPPAVPPSKSIILVHAVCTTDHDIS